MIVGYVRVSVKDDLDNSILNQINLIKKYCISNNYSLDKIYVDNGVSGITYDRDGFNKLIQDVKGKKIKMIIIKDISRLGRDAVDTSYYINCFFKEYNVILISLDNYNEEVLINIKSIMNEYYVKDTSVKRKNTANLKTMNKEFIGVKAPFGYKICYVDNKRTLEINKYEASFVKLAFKKRLEGYKYEDIANQLNLLFLRDDNELSHYMSIKSWNSLKVRRMLENVVYKGDLVVRKTIKDNYKEKKRKYISKNDHEIIKNAFPPIISEDIFYEVNSLVKKYKSHKKRKEISLYDNIIFCPKCNLKMSYYQRYKDNVYQYYFKCLNCKKSIFLSRLDKIIEDTLSGMLKLIDKEKICEIVTKKINQYLQIKCKTLYSKINTFNIKYVETYKRKYILKACVDSELDSIKLCVDEINKKIDWYKDIDFKEQINAYLENIDIHFIIDRIEVNSLIKIYYHIKKA